MSPRRHSTRIFLITAVVLTMALIAIYPPRDASATGPASPVGTSEDLSAESSAGPLPVPVREQNLAERRVVMELRRGEALGDLLRQAGLTGDEAYDAALSLAGILDMRRLQEGQEVNVVFQNGNIPSEVSLPVSYDRTVVTRNDGGRWASEEMMRDIVTIPTVSRAVVNTSLYQAAKDAGIPLSVMMEAIGLFSFEVDFQRDIQSGEEITLLWERLVDEDGEFAAAGELLYARLELADRNVESWRYESLEGKVGYYEADGASTRKALLKTPVDGARISSGFGLRRHPILGYTALHRGMDFAVGVGTPVMSAGEGMVVIAGWHDQYGWRVKVRHANHYDTMYAHFSSIARGIAPGVRVEQGQVVGYVGSTGMSTGPHCHYEVHYYGQPVNPATLKFPPGHSLEGEDLRLFRLECLALLSEFEI